MRLARFLCVVGLHTGQKRGGTLSFMCPRCKRSLWQREDFSDVNAITDQMIAQGHGREALDYARREVGRRA